MKAVVRTVIEGSAIEELPAEILGVMENALGPGQSLILVRLEGDRAEFTGVAAGMSGSPVYVDGRLVGALAYRLGRFTKEPIAGITPIQYMLDLTRSGAVAAGPLTAASGPEIPLTFPVAAGEGAVLRPIETPLVVSGLHPALFAHFAPAFSERGLAATAGAGGAVPDGSTSGEPIRPGDPIAAQLVSGDMSIAATGTVTHVDGDRVYAFGHPFLLNGPADFPMARAEILTTLASIDGSSKLSRILETVGAWEQIRLPGIAGTTARTPDVIPMTVRVQTPGGAATYSYGVAQHRDWTPFLSAISLAASLMNTPAHTNESTIAVTGRIELEGHEDVELENLYSAMGGSIPAAAASATDVQAIFGAIFQNRFEAPVVRSIDIVAEGIEEGRLSFVEGVWPSRTEAIPGEEVEYQVRVRSFRGVIDTLTLVYRVPENAPKGTLRVQVGGGAYLTRAERTLLVRRVRGADSLDQLISIVNHLRRSDRLYGRAVRTLPGAIVQSEVLPALPPSVLTTLRANRGSGEVSVMQEDTVWEASIPVDSIVVGGATLSLKIR